MDARAANEQKAEKEATFLQEILAICCGVISPRSLNGLNHCNVDNDFHIANQEQNISMYKINHNTKIIHDEFEFRTKG